MIINALVNSKDCWGQRPIDQNTPWDVSLLNEEQASAVTAAASSISSSIGLLGDALKQRRGVRGVPAIANSGAVSVESNVWPSEPPTGTGIWEMHYESIGDRSGRWKSQQLQPNPSSSSSSTGPRLDSVNSPPGSHRIMPSFMNPSSVPPQPQAQQGRGGFQNNFFTQQRFGQAGAQPPPASGREVLGPNGILGAGGGGGVFKPQGSVGAQGWPLSLTPDSQSE